MRSAISEPGCDFGQPEGEGPPGGDYGQPNDPNPPTPAPQVKEPAGGNRRPNLDGKDASQSREYTLRGRMLRPAFTAESITGVNSSKLDGSHAPPDLHGREEALKSELAERQLDHVDQNGGNCRPNLDESNASNS